MIRDMYASAFLAAAATAAAVSPPQLEPTQVRVRTVVDVFGDEPAPNAYTAGGSVFAFRTPVRCDSQGTAILEPYQSLSSGRSNDVLIRLTASGQRTLLELSAAIGLAPGAAANISVTSMDAAGNVYALASVGSERRVMASWDNEGQFRWKRALDESTLAVELFGVFATGEFLLVAHDRRTREDVVAITDGTSEPRRVEFPFTKRGDVPERLLAEPGADGRIYLTQALGDRIYAIAPTGSISASVETARPRGPDVHLASLHVSRGRIAATYQGKPTGQPLTTPRWVVVHDVDTGRHVATYGPLPKMLICYQHLEGGDQFTMLNFAGANWQRLVASVP